MGDKTVLDAFFTQRLARFICYDHATHKHDEAIAKLLANKLGISIKNMLSWATGGAYPPPMKKKEIEELLDSLEEQTKPSGGERMAPTVCDAWKEFCEGFVADKRAKLPNDNLSRTILKHVLGGCGACLGQPGFQQILERLLMKPVKRG